MPRKEGKEAENGHFYKIIWLTNLSPSPRFAWLNISRIQSGVWPRVAASTSGLDGLCFFLGGVTPVCLIREPRRPLTWGLWPFPIGLIGDEATNRDLTKASASGDFTSPGEMAGTETFGLRGCSCGGGGTGGGWTPLELPGGSGGTTKFAPGIDNREPGIICRDYPSVIKSTLPVFSTKPLSKKYSEVIL